MQLLTPLFRKCFYNQIPDSIAQRPTLYDNARRAKSVCAGIFTDNIAPCILMGMVFRTKQWIRFTKERPKMRSGPLRRHRQGNDKGRPFVHFTSGRNKTMMLFYNVFAKREADAGSLARSITT